MNKVYALTIMNGVDVDFQCLISEDGKYLRVQIDELDYETMINEMLESGYTSVKQIGIEKPFDEYEYEKPIYEETLTTFKTPQDIYNALLEDGFECILKSQSEFNDVLEISVDGKDLGIEVITATNKMKITETANNFFKATNNEDYEPIEREKSGSYSLILSDTKTDSNIKKNMLQIIDELHLKKIDRERFFKKDYYYAFIMSFIEIGSMRHLDILTLKVGEKENEKISLTKQKLFEIKRLVEDIQMSKIFTYTKSKGDRLTAFEINNKNERKFKLHSALGFENGKVRNCYIKSAELYEKIQKHTQDSIHFKGYYKSATRTVIIESATIEREGGI